METWHLEGFARIRIERETSAIYLGISKKKNIQGFSKLDNIRESVPRGRSAPRKYFKRYSFCNKNKPSGLSNFKICAHIIVCRFANSIPRSYNNRYNFKNAEHN